MIQVNELRKGILIHRNNEMHTVRGWYEDSDGIDIVITDKFNLGRRIEEFEEILLTHERLMQLGFHLSEYPLGYQLDYLKYMHIAEDNDGSYYLVSNNICVNKRIVNIHHLQNLFYDLTAEELPIKTLNL